MAPIKMLTREEAAKYLGVSRSWLFERSKKGEGPAYVRIGGKVRYFQEALDAYIQANVVHPDKEGTKSGEKEQKSSKTPKAKAEIPMILTQADIDLALRLKKAGKLK